jgi:hypothetical protein
VFRCLINTGRVSDITCLDVDAIYLDEAFTCLDIKFTLADIAFTWFLREFVKYGYECCVIQGLKARRSVLKDTRVYNISQFPTEINYK